MSSKYQLIKWSREKNTRLWRFMSFTNFVSLLEKRALFMSKIDSLFDELEYIYPFNEYSQSNVSYNAEAMELMEEFLEKPVSGTHELKDNVYINCWHISDEESAALWEKYSRNNEGIAILSSFERIHQSFAENRDNISISEVTYLDYKNGFPDVTHPLEYFLYKRKSFEYEKEARIMMMVNQEIKPELHYTKNFDFMESGIYAPLNLDILIDKIFISPLAQEWFESLVKSISEKYGLSKEISRTNLSRNLLM